MANPSPQDRSNGYEEVAETFMRVRNRRIGAATVREWSRILPRGCSVLDLGCGHGVPITQVLIDDGFAVYSVDASAKMIAAFRARFPNVPAECAGAEDSDFFGRTFEAITAWGLMFLLPADVQAAVIGKIGKALNPAGRFLFTAPRQAVTWSDSLTGRVSISLGVDGYRQILRVEGLLLDGEQDDEGDNHYYLASKPNLPPCPPK